jgi:hypothetical protein
MVRIPDRGEIESDTVQRRASSVLSLGTTGIHFVKGVIECATSGKELLYRYEAVPISLGLGCLRRCIYGQYKTATKRNERHARCKVRIRALLAAET